MKKNVNLLAISGKGGSGKDSLCKYLIDYINKLNEINLKNNLHCIKTYSLSFADPVKKIAKILFPQIKDEWLYGPSQLRSTIVPGIKLNNKDVTVRELLIDIGESYKKYDSDIFVKIFDNSINKFKNENYNENILIIGTDLRFLQEFDYISNNNFLSIRIKRDNNIKLNNKTETIQDQISDDKFNFIINNNKSLDDLKKEAEKILLYILQ